MEMPKRDLLGTISHSKHEQPSRRVITLERFIMPQKPMREQLEEARTELTEQQEKSATLQKATTGLEQDLATLEGIASEVDTVLAEYSQVLKDLGKRWKESEKFVLAKKESIPHRKELGERIEQSEAPILKEIETRKG